MSWTFSGWLVDTIIEEHVLHLITLRYNSSILWVGKYRKFRGVWSKNSCGFTRVVFQQSPEPFTTLKWACTLCVLVDRRKEQHVALALMIALMMKMRHVL